MATPITWTLPDGRTIAVAPDKDTPQTWLTVTVDGQIGDGQLLHVDDGRLAKVAPRLRAAGYSHAIVCGFVAFGVPVDLVEPIKALQGAGNRSETLHDPERWDGLN